MRQVTLEPGAVRKEHDAATWIHPLAVKSAPADVLIDTEMLHGAYYAQ